MKTTAKDMEKKFMEQFGEHVKRKSDWELDEDNEGFSTLYTDQGKDFFKWDGEKWGWVGSKEW